MTTVPCTHPGCTDEVDLPSDRFHGAVLALMTRAAVCEQHEPDEAAPETEAEAPSVMSTWRNRVPADIVRVYGQAPSLSDLPETITGLPYLHRIAEAWPERWTPLGGEQPVRAIVLAGSTGSLKTTTAYALAFDMVRRMDRPDQHRTRVHIATEGDLLGDSFNDRGFATPAAPSRAVRRADIVIVDDVGTARFNSGGNRTNSWWALMNEVSTRGKFLMLTTNLADERQLWDHIGAAAFSRLAHMWGKTIPGGFEPPTSNNPTDRGYWPTPINFFITPTTHDYRLLGPGGHDE